MSGSVHICVTSGGLDDLTMWQQADGRTVLAHLDRAGRFSVFEATANLIIANTLDRLTTEKLMVVDSKSVGFPWLKAALTDAGRARIADPAASPKVTEPGR